ncbi:transposase, partial [Streptomyces sp. SID6041]|nr:transposase [Streptomyces sp. SID6041]
QAEAALAEALDALMRRARAGQATAQEQHLLNRTTTLRTPPPRRSQSRHQAPQPQPGVLYAGEDSLDGLDQDQETDGLTHDEPVQDPAGPVSGYGLYDAEEEALKW